MNDSILLIQSQDTKKNNMGTGFVIYNDENGSFILTCNHVLEAVGEPKIDDYEVEEIAKNKFYDLALLYVKGLVKKKPFVLKETSLSLSQDKEVSLIGYRSFSKNEYRKNTRKAKIFDKGIHKEENIHFDVWEIMAQKDNHILRGYSGSPLILNGQVIGVMTNKEQADRGFATSIKYLSTIWKDMPNGLILQENKVNPFVGLSPFTQKTKAFFFGRDKEIKEISHKLEKSSFLAVIGDSGSGKSSIIKAGVIPYYKDKNSYVLELRPANNPYIELSHPLKKRVNSDDNEELLFDLHVFCQHEKATLLIYIDQFEELFTLTSKDKRDAFIETLLYIYNNNVDSKLKIDIVFTMRSDYFPQLQQYTQFYKLIMNENEINQVRIESMNKKQLKETIVKPLLKVELVHEEEANSFADLVILNMGNQANEVTLLQNALTIIWHGTKQGKTLVEAYKTVGGVGGALPTLANATIEAIASKNNKDIQAIFLRLLKYAKKGNHTRRIAEKGEFSVKQWELVQLLSSALNSQGKPAIRDDEKLGRLLKLSGKDDASEQSVELIHETLITSWITYSDWVQEFGFYKMTHDIVIEKTKEYEREEASLLMGSDLDRGVQLLDSEYRKFLSEDESLYVFESKKFREEEHQDKEQMIDDLRIKEYENQQVIKNLKIEEQKKQKVIQDLKVEEEKSQKLIKGLFAFTVLVIGLMGFSWYLKLEAEKSKDKVIKVLGDATNGAIVVLQKNDVSNVRLSMRPIVKEFKDSKDIRIQRIVSQAWFVNARALEKVKSYSTAIKEYHELTKHFKNNKDSKVLRYVAQSLFNQGFILEKLKQYQLASKNYINLIQNFKDSEDIKIIEFVAMAWSRQIVLDDKEIRFTNFLNFTTHFLENENTVVHKQLAKAYGNMGWLKLLEKDYKKSIELSLKGIRIEPNEVWIHLHLLYAYLLNNQLNKAKEIYVVLSNQVEIIKDDLKKLRDANVTSLHFSDIEKLFNK
ncbi:MAG: Unknown protein [uncultured Sulfurovum sp.]|uniref:Novel STAND NTPase 1 domain-containing protein n=1 Tax=uncultured Sulfurovum sp. TaxID=269237 RepID=A0A6S6TFA2_9BACT|nr:MAG: Unknown protein [uncultured Sulfurovum sp.]